MEQLILSSRDCFFPDREMACCIGVFDGVHCAHKQIFEKTVTEARKNKMDAVCITFSNHPDTITKSEEAILLNSLSEKLKTIEGFGFDKCIILSSSPDLFLLSYEEFNFRFLSKAKIIVVGSDFRYGFNRLGNVNTFPKSSLVIALDLLKEEDFIISSSLIRKYLKEGNIDKANKLLDHPLTLCGEVIKGNQIGRTIGFRTANIVYPEYAFVVKYGVYKVKVLIDNIEFIGIANIGIKPTIGNSECLIETHIFDFNDDLYGKIISVSLISFIREEKKFSSLEELMEQIKKDIKEVKG